MPPAGPGRTTATRTPLEAELARAGVVAVELGRASGPGGDRTALLVPEEAVLPKALRRTARAGQLRLFSPTGGSGRAFRIGAQGRMDLSLAVMPFDLARELLDRAEASGGLPAQDRGLVAAYVEAYFGSAARLLGLEEGAQAARAGVGAAARTPDPAGERAALDAMLAAEGWRPPVDMLDRLGLDDAWIRESLLPGLVPEVALGPGLAVFFLRAAAETLGHAATAASAIEAVGFEILRSVELDPDQSEALRRTTRGGNWEAGPFPVGGGPPVRLFFGLDVFPYRPGRRTSARHPLLDNGRILACKEQVRRAILRTVPAGDRFNPVHSSDTSAEALRVAATVLGPEGAARIETIVAQRREQVLRAVGGGTAIDRGGRDAMTVRLETDAGTCVRRVFRPHVAGRVRDAVALHRALAEVRAVVPDVLRWDAEAGYVDFAGPGAGFEAVSAGRTAIGLDAARKLSVVVRTAGALGWRLDWRALFDSVLVSPSDGIRVIGASGWRVGEGARGQAAAPAALAERDYEAFWAGFLRMPKSVFLSGRAGRMILWRLCLCPGATAGRRLGRLTRRAVERLRGRAGWA